jgi:hypothetical protein
VALYIERAGFDTFPAGLGMAAQVREARAGYPGFHPRTHVFSTPDLEFTLTKIWAGIGARPGSGSCDRSWLGGARSW